MIFKKSVVLIALCVATGCLNSAKSEIQNQNPISRHEVFQEKLLNLHNKERTSRGYSELKMDKDLCRYAQTHAEKMAKTESLQHSNMSDLMKVINSGCVGENIAWGQESEKEVVESWMWSPGHRWNILGSSYKRVGFGMKKDAQNREYWCVVFSD